jgi:hypothetical protein
MCSTRQLDEKNSLSLPFDFNQVQAGFPPQGIIDLSTAYEVYDISVAI